MSIEGSVLPYTFEESHTGTSTIRVTFFFMKAERCYMSSRGARSVRYHVVSIGLFISITGPGFYHETVSK